MASAEARSVDEPAAVAERGDIRFLFRPTVQAAAVDEPFGAPGNFGVQSFFMVLSSSDTHRRIRVGRKRMPIPPSRSSDLDADSDEIHASKLTKAERFWCRVERVGSLDRVIGGLLEDAHYLTKTRGERYQPAARPIAHGCYAFVRHADHVHLVYRIEHAELDDVPDDVRVPDAASNVVLFENTAATTKRGRKATWTVAGEVDRLDHEGEEFVLVGVDDDPERELGITIIG